MGQLPHSKPVEENSQAWNLPVAFSGFAIELRVGLALSIAVTAVPTYFTLTFSVTLWSSCCL